MEGHTNPTLGDIVYSGRMGSMGTAPWTIMAWFPQYPSVDVSSVWSGPLPVILPLRHHPLLEKGPF